MQVEVVIKHILMKLLKFKVKNPSGNLADVSGDPYREK